MFRLFGYALRGENEKETISLDRESWEKIYKLSKKHDLAHLIGYALKGSENKIDEDIQKAFEQAMNMAAFRYVKISYDLETISNALEKAQIRFIPLKGSVIRKYYKEPWLRTSCDIDVLVKEKDADNAAEYLQTRLQYRCEEKWQHDISLFSPSNVHVELHFKLLDSDFKQVKELIDVWSGDEISLLSDSEYQMSKELFLLYHIYHMAKHFIHGGCGIKPFIDLWIIKNKVGFDEEKAQKMLQESGLLAFFERSTDLVNVWFEGKEHSEITQEMEDYVLQGGVYGTLEQHIAMSQNKKGGKFRHLMGRIFFPYKSMVIYYPSLKKCPILFPFYQVRRWFRILFCGGRKAAMNEIKLNQSISEEKKQAAKRLIDELGL